jgi:hypothetical protein
MQLFHSCYIDAARYTAAQINATTTLRCHTMTYSDEFILFIKIILTLYKLETKNNVTVSLKYRLYSL